MKKLILPLIIFLSTPGFAQKKVSQGSIGLGLHLACPQSELGVIDYDDGIGLNISYLSRKFPYKSPVNFQLGARMDFAHMQTLRFESIILAQDDGPLIIGDANIEARNRMYGLFAEGRINFADEFQKVSPYLSLLAGHRNYTTYQVLSLNQPNYNPEREAASVTERVVHTNRFHYGGTVGIIYKLNNSISLESSITYTFGHEGAALPLKDIVRENGSNEVKYNNYQTVKTDILLINAGIRFNLSKTYNHSSPSNDNSLNKYNSLDSKRYYDNSTRNNSNSGSISIPRSNTPTKKQYPIKVKSDGPKRGKNDNS
ncbi:MAG: hypothetical protein EBR72_02580 [Bacteroidetes bacterium]|nr:hypothetical protein [Bacteroidota bacterium]